MDEAGIGGQRPARTFVSGVGSGNPGYYVMTLDLCDP